MYCLYSAVLHEIPKHKQTVSSRLHPGNHGCFPMFFTISSMHAFNVSNLSSMFLNSNIFTVFMIPPINSPVIGKINNPILL